MLEQHDRHEVADGEAVRGGVEPGVDALRLSQVFAQCILVRGLMEEAAPFEFVDEVGHGRRRITRIEGAIRGIDGRL
jgi:hypothetical protein